MLIFVTGKLINVNVTNEIYISLRMSNNKTNKIWFKSNILVKDVDVVQYLSLIHALNDIYYRKVFVMIY